jgi:hypothetical protein
MVLDNREILIERATKDLIGPFSGLEEILFAKPSDNYLTGIVNPKGTTIPDEQLEDEDETNSGKDDGSDDLERGVSGFRRFKPCTAGVSFAVEQTGPNPSLEVDISFGKYLRGVAYCPFQKAQPSWFDGKETHEPKLKFDTLWFRSNCLASKTVAIVSGMNEITFDVEGFEAISLHLNVRALSDGMIVTAQIVNNFEPNAEDDFKLIEENTLFQFELKVRPSAGVKFKPRYSSSAASDEDSRISQLIYRNVQEFATGHNSSADWKLDNNGECFEISTSWMPRAEVKPVSHSGDYIFEEKIAATKQGRLSAEAIFSDEASLFELSKAVLDAYAEWIDAQETMLNSLQPDLQGQAKQNLERCREAQKRISEGLVYLSENRDACKAFQLANLVMRVQRQWADGKRDWRNPQGSDLIWRPFQLAFALMCIPSASDREHCDRKVFDLIWFPTGGGKTEAYLLLSAYVLMLRRLRHDGNNAKGLSVMMRYTLRTLTVQQYQRAASMITACEVIRSEEYFGILGNERFSIGLWVGEASTPNHLHGAFRSINEEANPNSTPAQVKLCPRCIKSNRKVLWESNSPDSDVIARCSNEDCAVDYPFNNLPFLTVDEQIYKNPPSLLIGTVDKFAQITRNKKCAALFGISTASQPPDLVIQDELHLIAGPLGSLTGLYETAIDELCKTSEGPVKIIGSTATIRRAEEQVNALFARDAFQFPPAAIDADNSGFAKTDAGGNGRIYLGVSTAGRSPKFALQAVAASLLQSGKDKSLNPDTATYYDTLVSYYNSLKELGGALVVMQDDVPDTLNVLAKRRGEKPRSVSLPEELTSRKPSSEIPDILDQLSKSSDDFGFIDILLASNMLSVGVDIPRLGLMLVNGQPKSMSEYIQATSRVGRTLDGPGLVITLYNDSKIRDRAHFETFKTWHSALYRSVEASSVTPFSSRARDKALHAPLVALARHKLGINKPKISDTQRDHIKRELFDVFKERIESIDKREWPSALRELEEFLDYWEMRSEVSFFWNDKAPNKSLLISAEIEAARLAAGRTAFKSKATPNSVRNVEPASLFKLKEFVTPLDGEGEDGQV